MPDCQDERSLRKIMSAEEEGNPFGINGLVVDGKTININPVQEGDNLLEEARRVIDAGTEMPDDITARLDGLNDLANIVCHATEKKGFGKPWSDLTPPEKYEQDKIARYLAIEKLLPDDGRAGRKEAVRERASAAAAHKLREKTAGLIDDKYLEDARPLAWRAEGAGGAGGGDQGTGPGRGAEKKKGLLGC